MGKSPWYKPVDKVWDRWGTKTCRKTLDTQDVVEYHVFGHKMCGRRKSTVKCPYCGCPEQRVLESRPSREGDNIRRRRECVGCDRRFTTFEEPEKPRLFVIKRDGTREEFDREKALKSMTVACRKRPVSIDAMRGAVGEVERELFDLCEPEVASQEIGERIMGRLLRLDTVAYVRFASVYREFETLADFREIVETTWLLEKEPLSQ